MTSENLSGKHDCYVIRFNVALYCQSRDTQALRRRCCIVHFPHGRRYGTYLSRERNLLALPTLDMYLPLSNI